jgi:hypothetical protein
MKKVFARATYKRYLPEMMIYIAVWLIVLMVPVVSNFFELLSGKVEVMRWKGVFILWLNVLPFFFLFLLNNRVLAPFLFLKQKVVVYVVVAILYVHFVGSGYGVSQSSCHEAAANRTENARPGKGRARAERA